MPIRIPKVFRLQTAPSRTTRVKGWHTELGPANPTEVDNIMLDAAVEAATGIKNRPSIEDEVARNLLESSASSRFDDRSDASNLAFKARQEAENREEWRLSQGGQSQAGEERESELYGRTAKGVAGTQGRGSLREELDETGALGDEGRAARATSGPDRRKAGEGFKGGIPSRAETKAKRAAAKYDNKQWADRLPEGAREDVWEDVDRGFSQGYVARRSAVKDAQPGDMIELVHPTTGKVIQRKLKQISPIKSRYELTDKKDLNKEAMAARRQAAKADPLRYGFPKKPTAANKTPQQPEHISPDERLSYTLLAHRTGYPASVLRKIGQLEGDQERVFLNFEDVPYTAPVQKVLGGPVKAPQMPEVMLDKPGDTPAVAASKLRARTQWAEKTATTRDLVKRGERGLLGMAADVEGLTETTPPKGSERKRKGAESEKGPITPRDRRAGISRAAESSAEQAAPGTPNLSPRLIGQRVDPDGDGVGYQITHVEAAYGTSETQQREVKQKRTSKGTKQYPDIRDVQTWTKPQYYYQNLVLKTPDEASLSQFGTGPLQPGEIRPTVTGREVGAGKRPQIAERSIRRKIYPEPQNIRTLVRDGWTVLPPESVHEIPNHPGAYVVALKPDGQGGGSVILTQPINNKALALKSGEVPLPTDEDGIRRYRGIFDVLGTGATPLAPAQFQELTTGIRRPGGDLNVLTAGMQGGGSLGFRAAQDAGVERWAHAMAGDAANLSTPDRPIKPVRFQKAMKPHEYVSKIRDMVVDESDGVIVVTTLTDETGRPWYTNENKYEKTRWEGNDPHNSWARASSQGKPVYVIDMNAPETWDAADIAHWASANGVNTVGVVGSPVSQMLERYKEATDSTTKKIKDELAESFRILDRQYKSTGGIIEARSPRNEVEYTPDPTVNLTGAPKLGGVHKEGAFEETAWYRKGGGALLPESRLVAEQDWLRIQQALETGGIKPEHIALLERHGIDHPSAQLKALLKLRRTMGLRIPDLKTRAGIEFDAGGQEAINRSALPGQRSDLTIAEREALGRDRGIPQTEMRTVTRPAATAEELAALTDVRPVPQGSLFPLQPGPGAPALEPIKPRNYTDIAEQLGIRGRPEATTVQRELVKPRPEMAPQGVAPGVAAKGPQLKVGRYGESGREGSAVSRVDPGKDGFLVTDPETGKSYIQWRERKLDPKKWSLLLGMGLSAEAAGQLLSSEENGDGAGEGPEMLAAGFDGRGLMNLINPLIRKLKDRMVQGRVGDEIAEEVQGTPYGELQKQRNATRYEESELGLGGAFRKKFVDARQLIRNKTEDWAKRYREQTGLDLASEVRPDEEMARQMGGGGALERVWRTRAFGGDLEEVYNRGLHGKLENLLDTNITDRALDSLDTTSVNLSGAAQVARLRGLSGSKLEAEAAHMRGLPQSERAPMGATRGDAAQVRAKLLSGVSPEDRALLLKAVDNLDNYAARGLRDAAAEGLLDPRVVENLLASKHPYARIKYVMKARYVPGEQGQDIMYTVRQQRINNIERKGGRLSVADEAVVRKLKGANEAYRVNESPLKATMESMEELGKEIARNKAAKSLVHPLTKDPLADMKIDAQGKITNPNGWIADITGRTEPLPAGYSTVSYFKDGSARTLLVPNEIAEATNFSTALEVGSGIAALGKARTLLQMMATSANLGFMLKNIPKDITEAFMLTPGLGIRDVGAFAKLWARNVYQVKKGMMTDMREEYMRAGGSQSGLTASVNPRVEAYGETPRNPVMKVVRGSQRLLNATEEATKESVYELLRRKGVSEAQSAYWTRNFGGSPDFAVRGTAAPRASEWVMFFNPQVQGADRIIRAYKTDPWKMAEHLAGITIAAGSLHAWNSQFINPDTGRPEIEEVPEDQKHQSIVIMIPGQRTTNSLGQSRQSYVRIPLGHAAQVLYTPIFDAIRAASGDPSVSLEETVADTASTMIPGNLKYDPKNKFRSIGQSVLGALNPVAKVPGELWSDVNAQTGTPIEGRRESQGLRSERANARSSPFFRELHRAIPALPTSPLQSEHILRSFVPGLGEMGLALADAGVRSLEPGTEKIRSGAEKKVQAPIIGQLGRGFLSTPSSQTREDLANRLFGTFEQVQQYMTSIREYDQSASPDAPSQAERLRGDPMGRVAEELSSPLRAYVGVVAQLSKEKQLVQDSDLPPREKEVQLRALWQDELAILREADALLNEAGVP